MRPTAKDIERAHQTLFGAGTYEQRVAQLIADVRAEQKERDAKVCDDLEREIREAEPPPRSYECAWMATVAKYIAERIRRGES